jgi:predicted transcriptional regulator
MCHHYKQFLYTMAQYRDIFEELGLAKNEARVYETLLREGESGVGDISVKSGVHRRNVYDSLNRLIERGLVFERVSSTEHRYQATDPRKLVELLKEKEEKIQNVLPDLEKLYKGVPHIDDVVIYRGIEGWKNYLRDIISVGQDVYSIGAKGRWIDERLAHVLAQTARESVQKKLQMYWLFDYASLGAHKDYEKSFNLSYRYLPEGYDTTVSVDIFGDHVVFLSGVTPKTIAEEYSVVTLINQHTADAFRSWFDLLWIASGTEKKEKKKA